MKYQVGIILACALGLTSCGGPSCSGSDVLALVKKIEGDAYKQSPVIAGMMDIDATVASMTFEAIRTVGTEGNVLSCKADLKIKVVYSKLMLQPEFADKLAKASQLLGQGANGSIINQPISYDVQPTDDGKQIYVTISNDEDDE